VLLPRVCSCRDTCVCHGIALSDALTAGLPFLETSTAQGLHSR
jgi:hypothetical protein